MEQTWVRSVHPSVHPSSICPTKTSRVFKALRLADIKELPNIMEAGLRWEEKTATAQQRVHWEEGEQEEEKKKKKIGVKMERF